MVQDRLNQSDMEYRSFQDKHLTGLDEETTQIVNQLNALDRDAPRIPDLLRTAEQMGKEQKDAFLLNVLAWTYREREDCDNALRLFELVEELSPGETDAKQGIESCQ